MKKLFTKEIGLVLILAMIISVTACGKEITLEDWCNSSSEFQAMVMEAERSAGNDAQIDIYVEENTMYFDYKTVEVLDLSDARVKNLITEFFDEYMESSADELLDSMEEMTEKTKIKQISVQYNFYNGDGSELYSKTFTTE